MVLPHIHLFPSYKIGTYIARIQILKRKTKIDIYNKRKKYIQKFSITTPKHESFYSTITDDKDFFLIIYSLFVKTKKLPQKQIKIYFCGSLLFIHLIYIML